jgi:hypothetical protein
MPFRCRCGGGRPMGIGGGARQGGRGAGSALGWGVVVAVEERRETRAMRHCWMEKRACAAYASIYTRNYRDGLRIHLHPNHSTILSCALLSHPAGRVSRPPLSIVP